jgi:hypothetical protein
MTLAIRAMLKITALTRVCQELSMVSPELGNWEKTGFIDTEVMIDYLSALGTVKEPVEKRITSFLDAPVAADIMKRFSAACELKPAAYGIHKSSRLRVVH